MKNFLFYLSFLVLLSNNTLNAQLEYVGNQFPEKSRRVKLLIIESGSNALPSIYCIIKNKVYYQIWYLENNELEARWCIGYSEKNDSLRIVDYLDNQILESIHLYGDSLELYRKRATIFEYKKKRIGEGFKLINQTIISSNWRCSETDKYLGVLIPVSDRVKLNL